MSAVTSPTGTPSTAVPLCTALEGTLLRGNLAIEAIFRLLRADPGFVLLIPVLLLRGKGALWREVTRRSELDVQRLPYRESCLDFLREERAAGRSLVLVTRRDQESAERIARHVGLFDDVIATGENGARGETVERTLVRRFGPKGFDYAGSAREDLEIWPAARRAVVVSPSRRVARETARMDHIERTLPGTAPGWRTVLEAMRVHQWLKNILIFVPLLAAQQYGDWPSLLNSVLAFLSFSLMASATYVINDLFDLHVDRLHPSKRNRPLASGRLPLSAVPGLLAVLFGSTVALVLLALPMAFGGVLLGYIALTFAYSLKLKGAVLIDVIVLAGLYTLRVIAGAAATGISPSMWLLAFSMFLFLSLALVKRYAELLTLVTERSMRDELHARSYRKNDLHLLVSMGCASGYLSVLVLALYIVSDEASLHYSEGKLIWLVCPLLLYWISRAWIVVGRDEMHDDPLVWAVGDQISRWVAVIGALIVVFAQ